MQFIYENDEKKNSVGNGMMAVAAHDDFALILHLISLALWRSLTLAIYKRVFKH